VQKSEMVLMIELRMEARRDGMKVRSLTSQKNIDNIDHRTQTSLLLVNIGGLGFLIFTIICVVVASFSCNVSNAKGARLASDLGAIAQSPVQFQF
jgi:hypothetical protein